MTIGQVRENINEDSLNMGAVRRPLFDEFGAPFFNLCKYIRIPFIGIPRYKLILPRQFPGCHFQEANIVFLKHRDIEVVIPRNKTLMACRTNKGPTFNEKPNSISVTDTLNLQDNL